MAPDNKIRWFLRSLCRYPSYTRHLLLKKYYFLKRCLWAQKHTGPNEHVPLPLVYKLILTNKCNLHCKMCMFWGDVGWCKTKDGIDVGGIHELDWKVLEKMFRQVRHTRPSFILSGGEPFLYSHFESLLQMLKQNNCFATVCTNGTILDNFQETLVNNPFLGLLVSLDGQERENDIIRGKGVYKKVTENIKLLKSYKNPPYIGIQFTVMPENIKNMYTFCKEMVSLGVDWILLNPCWFISQEQAEDYERFMLQNFGIRPQKHAAYIFPYELDADEFSMQYQKIKNERWPIQISCYLDNPTRDIFTHLSSAPSFTGNRFCYKQWLRADITSDAKVVPCALFPDLTFGDLKKEDIVSVWNSTEYAKFRSLIRHGPLPICNKCDAIYLYDVKRKYL